jgi:hypothetical protein
MIKLVGLNKKSTFSRESVLFAYQMVLFKAHDGNQKKRLRWLSTTGWCLHEGV